MTRLGRKGIEVLAKDGYLAPIYKRAIEDEPLLQAIRRRRLTHIIVTLGGRTKQRLGFYLKRKSGASAGDSSQSGRPLPFSAATTWADRSISAGCFAAFQSPGDMCPDIGRRAS
jgi:hypothetical protein